MAVTVDWVISTVVNRTRGKLAAVSLSTTKDATNADLADPVYQAVVKWLGVTPADPTTVVDADLASLNAAQAARLLDAATLETLYTCLGACDAVDETAELETQKLYQIQQGIEEMIGKLEDRLRKPYGPSIPSASVGNPSTVVPNDPFAFWGSVVQPQDWPYPPTVT